MTEKVKTKNGGEDQYILKAQLGDMLEFDRGIYNHWAIYIGEGTVIHWWGDNDGMGHSADLLDSLTTIHGIQLNKARICETKISDVLVLGGTVRVNNYLDSTKKPLSAQTIVNRARSSLGKQGYNVVYNNCEHFATDCRYGKASSRQVQNVVIGTTSAVIVSTTIIGVACWLINSSKKDKDKRKSIQNMYS